MGGVQGQAQAVEDRPDHVPGRLTVAGRRHQARSGVEFNKAKAKGLVEGTLQKYIQPSYATATPEQQIAAIQQMVRDGVDGIFLLPLAGPPLAPAIDAAGKAGVPVVDPRQRRRPRRSTSSTSGRRTTRRQPPAWPASSRRATCSSCAASPGNPVEQAFQDAAVANIKACPGLKIVGTIYGKWTNATAKAETLKWLASHPDTQDRRRDPERDHDGRHRAGVPAGRPHGAADQRRRLPGRRLSWWLKNKATYKTVANCFNGYQTGLVGVPPAGPHPGRPRPQGARHPRPGRRSSRTRTCTSTRRRASR